MYKRQDISFSQEMPLTDLHWMISDRNRCLVLEQTKDGTEIYDNGFGVLTNNPPFPFHEANMSPVSYTHLRRGSLGPSVHSI